MDDWELDGEGRPLSKLTLHLDFSVMQVHNLLDVRQAKAEALHIMHIAGMYSIELFEDFLQVLLLHTHSRIGDGEVEMLVIIPGLHRDVERLIWLAILHSVVHQVEDDILEMHLIHIDA